MKSSIKMIAFIAASFGVARAGWAADKPNIVFILADDLGYGDLGCYGQTKIRTPNIDRLAATGMRFTAHYAGSNVCAPSRCVLLTGLHPGHAYIRENRDAKGFPEGQLPVPSGSLTLPGLLKKQGYSLGGFGKWGLGPVGSSGDPLKQGFDRWFGFNCQREAHNYYPTSLWDNDRKVTLDNPRFSSQHKLPAGADLNDPANYRGFVGRQYAPDLIAEQALNFIRDNKGQPFFLYLPTTVPHLALQAPEDSLREYVGRFPEEPYRGDRYYLPHRTPRAAYAAMITRMDREVGRIVALIEELGLDKQTIFVFTSDNGPLYDRLGGTDTDFFDSAGGFRGRKGSFYEGGFREPCIVRWTGRIPAGQTRDAVTGFEDWLPTLLELIGAKEQTPADIDGISFAPTLLGGTQRPRPFLYRESPGYGGQQSLRVGDWKMIRRNLNPDAEAKHQQPGAPELYDLATDSAEKRDVASTHPDVVARMQTILNQQHVKSALFPIRALDPAESVAPANSVAKPNVVVILIDDLGYADLGCQGNRFHETPHIDRLAADGMRFTTAYAACTVCSPTRAALLTGQYPARLHITDWIPGHVNPTAKLTAPNWTQYLPAPTWNLARAFREAGYATASVGKWHLGGPDSYPEQLGFDVNIGGTERGQPRRYFPPYGIATLNDGPPDEFLTDRLTSDVCRWIEKHASDPFFLYLPHFAVHTPLSGKPEIVAKYRRKAQTYGTRNNATYAALVESVDDSVGAIRQKLRDLKIDERTIILFTSDNGGLIGSAPEPVTTNAPLRAGKGSAYEGGVRVPMLWLWPHHTRAGSTSDVAVMTIDILPTLMSACGLRPPAEQVIDGESLMSLTRSGARLQRTALFWHYPHYHPGGATPHSAIRVGDWRLVEFHEDRRVELYNLKHDAEEKIDRASIEPEVVKSLKKQLDDWRESVGAQVPTPNPNYVPSKTHQ